MDNDHDWLTLHRVRFANVIDGTGNPMPAPRNARLWRFAPEGEPVRADGHRDCANTAWGGFASYTSKQDAEAVFADPQAHMPFLDQAVEAWHALVIPYAHRGEVNWSGTAQADSAIRVAATDPKGPLVVMTTAGYTDPTPVDEERVKDFLAGIDRVLDFYGTLPGNLRRGLYAGGAVDGREGNTMTLWRDDRAMISAAYKDGEHKAQMDSHASFTMFDRSSFTRGRVVASKGAWDGANPIDEIVG